MFRLRIIHGNNTGTEWELPEGDTVAGRDLQNGICIPDLHVSRRHFQISRRGPSLMVKNISRTNGTFVNGEEIVEKPLYGGDRILVGETLMEVFGSPFEEEPASSSLSISQDGHSTVAWMPADEERVARDNINYTVNARDTDILGIERENDLQRLRVASKQLQLLQDLGNTLVTEFDTRKLLEILLDRIFEMMPTDHGYIFLREGDGDRLNLHAARERGKPSGTQPTNIQVSYTLVSRALNEKIGVLSADTLSDDRFKNQGSIIMSGILSAMCVPLVFGDETLGLIFLDSRSVGSQFTEDDLRFLTMIGNQAAISLRNARLREQVVSESTIRAALGSYVSPQLLDRIVRGEITLESAAQQVEVSVLFADIRGFTRLSEQLSPQEVMGLLNTYCSMMARIVFEHNGLIDKYIGDAIMAVFGSPEPEPRHAQKATECAIAMQQAARTLTVRGQPVFIGVGVHTGTCVQGNVGHQSMMQFTAVGDTVNTASRLCSASGPGQITVSAITRATIGPSALNFVAMPPVALKGKANELEVYQVAVPSGQTARPGSDALTL